MNRFQCQLRNHIVHIIVHIDLPASRVNVFDDHYVSTNSVSQYIAFDCINEHMATVGGSIADVHNILIPK